VTSGKTMLRRVIAKIYLCPDAPGREDGFHQRMMVRAISQHMIDAVTSGQSCLCSLASAASIPAESIHI
jgi:hypothetical protein